MPRFKRDIGDISIGEIERIKSKATAAIRIPPKTGLQTNTESGALRQPGGEIPGQGKKSSQHEGKSSLVTAR